MCLSTIVKVVEGKDAEEVFSNVSEINVDGTRITCVDIIGSTYEVEGSIKSVDLIGNKIFVNAVS